MKLQARMNQAFEDYFAVMKELAYFTAKLPLIIRQSCHPFHTKAATHYTAKLPPPRR